MTTEDGKKKVEGRVVLDVVGATDKNRLMVTTTGDDFEYINEMRIYATQKKEPDLWIMSNRRRQELASTERNLIRAKVKAIVGCAVLGAAFAVTLGALVMAFDTKKTSTL